MTESSSRKWIALGAIALLAIAAGAILIDRDGDEGDDSAVRRPHCKAVKAPKPKKVGFVAPEQKVKRRDVLTAVVDTNCGTFAIALDARRSPKTVNSFVFLSEKGFYDGLILHRVAPDFLIQGGDPLADGTGGPGYSIEEIPPTNVAYTKGVVAMYKTTAEPPGHSGSQFLIVLADDAELPPEYALLGKINVGMDVVEGISTLATPAERTKPTVLIEEIEINKG